MRHAFTATALLIVGLILAASSGCAPSRAALASRADHLDAQATQADERATRESRARALRLWAEAAALHRQIGQRQNEGRILQNIGWVYRALGRPDSAFAYLHQGLRVARVARDRRSEAWTLNHIGIVHAELGRPSLALAYFQHALALWRATGDRVRGGWTLANIGIVYRDLRQPDTALAYLRQALANRQELEDRPGEGLTLGNIGVVYWDKGRPDSALYYYRQALKIAREVGDRAAEGFPLHNMGSIYWSLGRPDSALAYFEQALAVRREVGDREGQVYALSSIGDVYYQRSWNRDLRAALAHYDSAAAIRAALTATAGSGAVRVSYAELGHELFENWALAWLGRVADVGREARTLAALAVNERGREQALLELRVGSQDTLLPDPEMDEGPLKNAGADLVGEGRTLLDATTRTGATALSYLVTRDTLLAWLVLPTGKVSVARSAIRRDTLAALVSAARAEWKVGSAGDGQRAVAAKPNTAAGRRTASNARGAVARLASLVLPRRLVRSLPDTGELVILPHGSLALVPFAALPLRPGDSDGLGARYAVRYASSLASLRAAEARPSVTGSVAGQALIVGSSHQPTIQTPSGAKRALPRLRRAEREADWVAAKLGATAVTGQGASEDSVVGRMRDAAIVHLATRCIAYSAEEKARESFVAFVPSAEADGLLTVGEVIDDPRALSAELIVLSGCQSVSGDPKRTEWSTALPQAFLARGARSLMVSLWNASDPAMELLLRRFYTHWLEDVDRPTKAEALRRAQNDVRKTSRFREPRYWAGLKLVGAR